MRPEEVAHDHWIDVPCCPECPRWQAWAEYMQRPSGVSAPRGRRMIAVLVVSAALFVLGLLLAYDWHEAAKQGPITIPFPAWIFLMFLAGTTLWRGIRWAIDKMDRLKKSRP